MHGCGDLIFSSHTTFALVGVMSYQEYGTLNAVKVRRLLALRSSWKGIGGLLQS